MAEKSFSSHPGHGNAAKTAKAHNPSLNAGHGPNNGDAGVDNRMAGGGGEQLAYARRPGAANGQMAQDRKRDGKV